VPSARSCQQVYQEREDTFVATEPGYTHQNLIEKLLPVVKGAQDVLPSLRLLNVVGIAKSLVGLVEGVRLLARRRGLGFGRFAGARCHGGELRRRKVEKRRCS